MLFLLRQESFSMWEEAADFPLGVLKGIFFLFHQLERRPLCTLLYASKAYLPCQAHAIPLWLVPMNLALTFSPLWSPAAPTELPRPSFPQWNAGHRVEAESQTSHTGNLRPTQARGLGKPCRLSIAGGSEIQTSFLRKGGWENLVKQRMLCPLRV